MLFRSASPPAMATRSSSDGTFIDGSEAAGLTAHPTKGLALVLGDIDWDGDIDAFVANDSTRNLLFVNDGHGSFTEDAIARGIAVTKPEDTSKTSGTGIAVVSSYPCLSGTVFRGGLSRIVVEAKLTNKAQPTGGLRQRWLPRHICRRVASLLPS